MKRYKLVDSPNCDDTCMYCCMAIKNPLKEYHDCGIKDFSVFSGIWGNCTTSRPLQHYVLCCGELSNNIKVI